MVVQRQPDKYVYAEIGDPDAPEMVMALSHLDSPTASVTAAQLARWRDPFGNLGTPGAYHSSYIKDSWVYGAGIQDDSGPTLATLLAAKAMLEAGLPMDRRVRIVMGIYEDGGPGTPSAANTAAFQSIPYNANPSFYDNWAYKNLNREETPIAAYTSDSRFPVIVGNSGAVTPAVSMSLSADSGKAFRLTDARAGVTLRAGDPTLKDITYGSTTQIASRAIFTLDVTGAGSAERDRFVSAITAAATTKGWLPAAPGTTPKVQTTITGDSLTLEINTDVAMEMPTPQYGKNAVVWGMFLLSKGLGASGVPAADLQLKKAADGIADLFFRDGVEGEAYIGKYMGIPASLLRNPSNGTPNLTFALMGGINSETPISFYTDASGSLSIPMFVRSMHVTAADSGEATAAVTAAFQAKGFTLGALGSPIGAGLYVTHDNPLTALQFGSYQATINRNPAAFADPYALSDVVFPQGTTGGTLASNFRNKMTAFGAVIPGNERWWHTANERMKVDSAVQMTKMMADGMLEMARYSGPAGAKFMWADMPGLNADRADLDLLDVTIGTFKDASSAVGKSQLGGQALLGATSFNIPMWNGRGNSAPTAAAFALGHATGGVYLPLNDPEYLSSTYVAPMRLEFKVERPAYMRDADWAKFVARGYGDFKFNILVGDTVVPLAVPAGQSADKYFSSRISATNPDALYLSVNLAITDAPYSGVQPVLADSKTDLYTVNPAYLASNPDPFPGRGAKQQRGFFVFGDGTKNAEFSSPDAVYVTAANWISDEEPGDGRRHRSGDARAHPGRAGLVRPVHPGRGQGLLRQHHGDRDLDRRRRDPHGRRPERHRHRPPGQRRLLAPAAAAGLGHDRRRLRAGRRLLRADHAEGLERPGVQRRVHRQLQADHRCQRRAAHRHLCEDADLHALHHQPVGRAIHGPAVRLDRGPVSRDLLLTELDPQPEQRAEQPGEAGHEHGRERVGGVDVLPRAGRAEQDQREPDQLALERDADGTRAAVQPHRERGHAGQREPAAERLRRQRRQQPRPVLDHR